MGRTARIGIALAMLLVSGHAAVATTAQGVAAFQRGKYPEALKFLVPQAEKGDPDTMFALGQMYATGRGVEKDQQKAVAYFHKAAELGNADAQQSYGSALMLGEGVEQDMIEALKWFIVSARKGNKAATVYGGNVAKFMTREMRLEARSKALKWQQDFDKRTGAAQ
jgi:TPR repeat protein